MSTHGSPVDNVDLDLVEDVAALIRSFIVPTERDQALADLEAIITQLVDDVTQSSSSVAVATLTALLPELLRNATTWPYTLGRESLRAKIKWAVAKCGALNVAVAMPADRGVSYLIPTAEIVPIETDDAEVASEFEQAFASDGRISNMTRIMAFHPEFLKGFREFHNSLLGTVGPLPEDVRHFLAMMAASRYNCDYLVNVHLLHFKECDGCEEWLCAPDAIPERYRPWLVINSLLAYAPWQLNKGHFRPLEKGPDRWSPSEIVHGVLILAHLHALATFVFGVGLHPELDLQTDVPTSERQCEGRLLDPAREMDARQRQWLESTIQRLKTKDETHGASPSHDEEPGEDPGMNYQTDDGNRWRQLFSASALPSWDPVWEETHQDFNPHEYKLFRTTDNVWTDHLYNEVHKHCSELARTLDTEFAAIRNLTYAFIGQRTAERVDTRRVRWAIWNYCLRVRGIEVEGFDYKNINSMLPVELKRYCKAVSCYPDAMAPSIYHDVVVMQGSEKVHVTLLAMDARKHSSLLYAFAAMGFPSFTNRA